MKTSVRVRLAATALALLAIVQMSLAEVPACERMVELTFTSKKSYENPLADVDVDVLFAGNGRTWRVPAFWRGEGRWTVRFAPPEPGRYVYRLESSDRSNPDLNGHQGDVDITAYRGPNDLLRHGPPRVSADKRHFEHADGVPFYWLGDIQWTNLSDRISWDGFRELARDRKAKGYTVVLIAGGLIPSNEEVAPADPGFCNEGGCVWDTQFHSTNPRYFDYADRRIQHLVELGMTPAIVGAWHQVMTQIGPAKLKRHWRYLIARYGAYPVFWVLGGEVYEPPSGEPKRQFDEYIVSSGWREVATYVRATDPYRRPMTVHEQAPPYDAGIGDPTLTDFDLLQPAHFGWPSIATAVATLNARTTRGITKPVVIGELNWEGIGGQSHQDAQRVGFWLSMLNGAAGFSYGTFETAEAYGTDKPIHRAIGSSFSWREGMARPGSYQVGLGAKLLSKHDWWRMKPRPEWITPRGTTLLDAQRDGREPVIDLIDAAYAVPPPRPDTLPAGDWRDRHGNMFLPYVAGIPSELRIAYLPYFGFMGEHPRPSILALEPGATYRTFFWQPDSGVVIDLGRIGASELGPVLAADSFDGRQLRGSKWKVVRGSPERTAGRLRASGPFLGLLGPSSQDLRVSYRVQGEGTGVLRYQDEDNYLAARYSPARATLELVERVEGKERILATTPTPDLGGEVELAVEVRGGIAATYVSDSRRRYSTPVTDVKVRAPGRAGVLVTDGETAEFDRFEIRRALAPPRDADLDRRMSDAAGNFRGVFDALPTASQVKQGWPSYREYGRDKEILLDVYRLPRRPWAQDWVLVMDAAQPDRQPSASLDAR